MSDITERVSDLNRRYIRKPECKATLEEVVASIRAQAENIAGFRQELDEVEQTLGKALGFPWFKDDQKNFPGATEANGVCIGEHTAGTLAQSAAEKLANLEHDLELLRNALGEVCSDYACRGTKGAGAAFIALGRCKTGRK